jgi:uncharacterized protein YebE (UPF0316 family)
MGVDFLILYLFIFFAKIFEVSLMTVRTVLITRGEKLWGSIIGFVEVILWLYLISNVLIGISENPVKMIVYSLGFACGNYLGSIIEEKLALGLLTINAIVPSKNGDEISEFLRKRNIGVTVVDAAGKDESKKMLIIHAKRKKKDEIVGLIESMNTNCVISINDIKVVYGGFGIRK